MNLGQTLFAALADGFENETVSIRCHFKVRIAVRSPAAYIYARFGRSSNAFLVLLASHALKAAVLIMTESKARGDDSGHHRVSLSLSI